MDLQGSAELAEHRPRGFAAPHQAVAVTPLLERAALASEGFGIIRGGVDPTDLAAIRSAIEALLARPAARRKELSTNGAPGSALELWRPGDAMPALRCLPIVRRLRGLSAELLGAPVSLRFDHAIIKPAVLGGDIAWHQDSAYWRRTQLRRRRLHWWLPLQDVALEQGCLEYLPGSHRDGRRPHVPLLGNPAVLHLPLVPGLAGTVCPLAAGDALAHLSHTVHRTGPNRTARPRMAYIMQFGALPFTATLFALARRGGRAGGRWPG
jgi:hypothetical protein